MRKIEKLSDIEVGDVLFSVSHQFNALNIIICLADDYQGLKRDIKYFGFLERMKEIPTAKEYAKSYKNNKTISHTFATWGFELEGENPSTALFRMDNQSHIKFCVAYSEKTAPVVRPEIKDHYENFEDYKDALNRYKKVLELENLFNAIISIVLDTTG